jgi:hypothetical protein
MRKFTEVLELYLDERDRQNSNYYEGRFIFDSVRGRYYMEDLAKELDEMVQGVKTCENTESN